LESFVPSSPLKKKIKIQNIGKGKAIPVTGRGGP
jgi:hypothetical protein